MEADHLLGMMRRRRSVREYSSEPVDDNVVERIMSAGLLAPSGADRKPYAIVVVREPAMKARIRDASEEVDRAGNRELDDRMKEWMAGKKITHQKKFLTDAPVLLVVAGDTGQPYWLESTWLSIAYMVLAAECEGLGSLTYTPSETGFLNELLELPAHYSPQAIIPLGRPAVPPKPKTASPEGKVFLEKYSE